MKIKYSPYYLLMLILFSVHAGARSQGNQAGHAIESLSVCTDRTLFIPGENILFSAFIYDEDKKPAGEFSRVLYCELITPDGSRIAGGKYAIESSYSQGCLPIPAEAISGIYYLRSYTRYMRNSGPKDYHYIMLKIVNPYKAEVLNGKEEKVPVSGQQAFPVEEQTADRAGIQADKLKYRSRENIELRMEAGGDRKSYSKYCLSVVPESSFKEMKGIALKDTSTGDIRYYPETRGVSVTGKLLETGTGQPVPNALVNLSIIGDDDVMAIRTNSLGQFYFALPAYSGTRDIFLCGEDLPGKPTEIFIDNDFCTRPVELPGGHFQLSEAESSAALRMAVNQKITSIYFPDTLIDEQGRLPDGRAFYGRPDEILEMEKYIDLPTMEEYFSELLGSVNVRKFEGRKIFRFNSDRTEMTIYDPLVLIDWVAVNDIDRVLAMSPRLIERIELVNSPYIKGNITYGGIISFVSKKNDYAGIDLPKSGTFINYKFLEACTPQGPSGPLPANIPDARNTVFWDPDVKLNNAVETTIHFTAPDTPGKYIVLLRGMGIEGEEVIAGKVIVVED